MSLFPECDSEFTVYRKTVPSGWVAPSWSTVGTIVGRVEPVAANEEILNRQDYQGITEVLFMDIEYKGIVQPDDYIVSSPGTVYQNRGIPEDWNYLIPYVMCKLERPQSPVEIPPSST